MSNYPVSPEENYDAIVEEMKRLIDELEQNPTMSEEEFEAIVKRHGRLGGMLKDYSDMIWKKQNGSLKTKTNK